ncbi:MAG: glycosyltransferase family 1 protein, partial [Pirellulaceae bacterium]|nr:glycosyltransferase family 1 protein [Pirellulaceae bacterium]
YFSSSEELIDKTEFYSRHEAQRAAVARAGYDRCQRDGYSYRARLQWVFEQLST